jgi:hypothetical protein
MVPQCICTGSAFVHKKHSHEPADNAPLLLLLLLLLLLNLLHHQALEKAAADESASVHTRSQAWSVFILAASAVLREGIESIIFLAGVLCLTKCLTKVGFLELLNNRLCMSVQLYVVSGGVATMPTKRCLNFLITKVNDGLWFCAGVGSNTSFMALPLACLAATSCDIANPRHGYRCLERTVSCMLQVSATPASRRCRWPALLLHL